WITAEGLYLAVLLFWMAAILVVLVIQTVSLNRKVRGSEVKFTRLAGQHQRLSEKAKTLKEAAEKDSLSGLLNRRGLELAFERLRQTGMPMALLLMDIDHFKRINDRRGHNEGDRIIQQMAKVLSSNTREQDVVARWGGEEFIILCVATQSEQAEALAEKIRNKIFQTEFDENKPLAITASFGVASFINEEALTSVLERADHALYEAKAQGRNCTVVAPTT
ncbi:MAG TPA: GGDEF domain-containing protein, partial [Cellvibrionaceae bacterium]